MSGYIWAKTPEGALFVVLMVDGKGFVPGLENAINMADVFTLGPVQWPTETIQQSLSSPPLKCGAPAADAIVGSNILAFAANG